MRIILNIFLTYSQRTISSLYERTHHEEKPHTLHSIAHFFGSCCIDVRTRSAGYEPKVRNSGLSEKPRAGIYPKSCLEPVEARSRSHLLLISAAHAEFLSDMFL